MIILWFFIASGAIIAHILIYYFLDYRLSMIILNFVFYGLYVLDQTLWKEINAR